ncbi:MAG TPA: hypothetical protein VNK96_08845 [Fimbriimonadales bacterium]|nr:hypothetical protein [Fimbriimonadales bacterium]
MEEISLTIFSSGQKMLTLAEAKKHIGLKVEVLYKDRLGNDYRKHGELLAVEYVPLYGTTLRFDFGEIGLEKTLAITPLEISRAA